jgi:hypothetical protein
MPIFKISRSTFRWLTAAHVFRSSGAGFATPLPSYSRVVRNHRLANAIMLLNLVQAIDYSGCYFR